MNFFGLQGDEARAQQMHDKWNHRLEQLYGKSGMFALKGNLVVKDNLNQ